MRVTNSSMMANQMYDNQQNLQRMNKLNEQINTSKLVNRVSDDPHKAVKIMRLNNEIKYTEKYNYNIDETVGWMNNTDSSLEELGTILGDVKEAILKIGNGTYSENEFKAIHAEVNEKIKELGEIFNTTHGGRYMFGGSNVDDAPMKVDLTGDFPKLSINNGNKDNLNADISDGTSIDYNISAKEIFSEDGKGNYNDPNTDPNTEPKYIKLINDISETMNKIANGTDVEENRKKLLGDMKEGLDEFFNRSVDTRTTFGVRVKTAEKLKEFNDENILNMKGVLSLDQDVDHVEKFIELKSAELIYQASIQVSSKLIQPTILDYLR